MSDTAAESIEAILRRDAAAAGYSDHWRTYAAGQLAVQYRQSDCLLQSTVPGDYPAAQQVAARRGIDPELLWPLLSEIDVT